MARASGATTQARAATPQPAPSPFAPPRSTRAPLSRAPACPARGLTQRQGQMGDWLGPPRGGTACQCAPFRSIEVEDKGPPRTTTRNDHDRTHNIACPSSEEHPDRVPEREAQVEPRP